MRFTKGFQCRSCSSFLSHPVDACPVCNDQFYWRVIYTTSMDDQDRATFLQTMTGLMDGQVTQEFLTHGGQLWLPFRFWDMNPSGDLLDHYDWIEDLELFQHNTKIEKPAEPRPQKKSEWDTIPKAPVPDFSKREKEKKPAAAAKAKPIKTPVKPAATQRKSKPKPKTTRKPPAKSKPRSSGSIWFAPAMIMVFFFFLSCSYMVLRYHKNQMKPIVPDGVNHERPVLP